MNLGTSALRQSQSVVQAPLGSRSESPRMDRFEKYLSKYRGPIFTYVVRLVKDDSAAEDICQETFIRLFRELDRIRDQTASAWLYRVARNLVTDYIRKKKPVTFTVLRGRSNDDDEETPALQFKHPGRGPMDTATNEELRKLIEETLEAMSEKFRDVLELVDVQQLTHDEVSEILGCSVKTVSARLARAREFFTHRISRHVNLQGEDGRASGA